MKKNCSTKYTLILIITLIIFLLMTYEKRKRKLAESDGEMIKLTWQAQPIDKNCRLQTGDAWEMILPRCDNLNFGEDYTIIGRAKTVSDNKVQWQRNLDVIEFYENSQKSVSVFAQWGRFFAYGERKIAQLRQTIISFFRSKFSNQGYQLLTALVLGTKAFAFDKSLKEQFSLVGLSHMVAVSGFHLSIVCAATQLLLETILGKRLTKFMLLPGLFFYVCLVGSPLSVMRAFLMFAFSFIGRSFFYKQTDSLLSLFFVFVLMSSFQILNIFNAGFLLSCLATLGILVFASSSNLVDQIDSNNLFVDGGQEKTPLKWLKRRLLRIKEGILATVKLSGAAQLLTLPVLAIVFQEYAWWSILSSLIFSPILVLITTLGVYLLLTLIVGMKNAFFQAILVKPIIFYLDFLLRGFYEIFVLYSAKFGKVAKFPSNLPVYIWISYYFCCAFLCYWRARCRRRVINYV